jgi:hypothetical protein
LKASPVDASLLTPFGLFSFHGLRCAVYISWLMPFGRFTFHGLRLRQLTPCGLFTLRGFLTNDSTCEAAVNNEVSTALRA